MRTTLERPSESYIAPQIGEPPLTLRNVFENSALSFTPQITSWNNPNNQAFDVIHDRHVAEHLPKPGEVAEGALNKINRSENVIFRGRDQIDAINKHLDAVPVNRLIDGDLVVLNGRPGRREQWGIVTSSKEGELFVYHTDSRYWSKTPLAELSATGRLKEAYRAKTYKW